MRTVMLAILAATLLRFGGCAKIGTAAVGGGGKAAVGAGGRAVGASARQGEHGFGKAAFEGATHLPFGQFGGNDDGRRR